MRSTSSMSERRYRRGPPAGWAWPICGNSASQDRSTYGCTCTTSQTSAALNSSRLGAAILNVSIWGAGPILAPFRALRRAHFLHALGFRGSGARPFLDRLPPLGRALGRRLPLLARILAAPDLDANRVAEKS